jgi:hypothetical protein
VARLLESTLDADLRKANGAIFQLRRARRNCAAGWVTLACQDYHAVVRQVPARADFTIETSMFDCRRSIETRRDKGRKGPGT